MSLTISLPKSPSLAIVLTISIPLLVSSAYFLFKRKKSRDNHNNNTLPRRLSNKRLSYSVIDETSMTKIETPTTNLETWTSLGLEQPMVIAMVGLPARGKSYIVKMIIRYLKWTGFECEVFNVGSYRRKIGHASADSSFFDTNNENANKLREGIFCSE